MSGAASNDKIGYPVKCGHASMLTMVTIRSRSRPQVGKDYPKDYADFLAWFPDDAACLDYLDWLRWPDGFSCPECSGTAGWRLNDGRWWCKACRRRISATAGTIFHRTKTPLAVWFAAAWHMTAAKNGISAKMLHRLMGFGSYETAWAMLHRFRGAIGQATRTRLSGDVLLDEATIVGARSGKCEGGAHGAVRVAVALEQVRPRGPGQSEKNRRRLGDNLGLEPVQPRRLGRCRLQVLANVEADTLRSFLLANVEPGANILTGGLASYRVAAGHDYVHRNRFLGASGSDADGTLPEAQRVASLVKRWLHVTHQGSFSADHMQAYLDEFSFRFNQRRSRSAGMLFYRLLEQSVAMHPLSFQELVANPRPRKTGEERPVPPNQAKNVPSSNHLKILRSPWRR